MNYRIGFSQDIHRLSENNRPLIIGGINIPFHLGPVSHSDGDVLYHAVAESILGALALGDLGTHFPDNDDKYLNMDSKIILTKVVEMMFNLNYEIVNIDTCIIMEKPKLAKYIFKMRRILASVLQIQINQVSIKAQTNEGCGEIGRMEAMQATSSVLLIKKEG